MLKQNVQKKITQVKWEKANLRQDIDVQKLNSSSYAAGCIGPP